MNKLTAMGFTQEELEEMDVHELSEIMEEIEDREVQSLLGDYVLDLDI